jgi:hypothetical protein
MNGSTVRWVTISSMSVFSSSSRSSRYTRRRRRHLLFVACAVLLAAASLGKGGRYDARGDPPEQDYERRVQGLLTGHGWVLSGSADLVSGVASVALSFQVPGCIGLVRVGILPLNGELTSVFSGPVDPDTRVFYIFRGRTTNSPPSFAYLHAKLDRLMGALGVGSRASSSVIAVSQPQGCRLEAAVPWSEL